MSLSKWKRRGAPGLSELLEPGPNWRSGWISSLLLPDPTNENLSNGKGKGGNTNGTQMERKWKGSRSLKMEIGRSRQMWRRALLASGEKGPQSQKLRKNWKWKIKGNERTRANGRSGFKMRIFEMETENRLLRRKFEAGEEGAGRQWAVCKGLMPLPVIPGARRWQTEILQIATQTKDRKRINWQC